MKDSDDEFDLDVDVDMNSILAAVEQVEAQQSLPPTSKSQDSNDDIDFDDDIDVNALLDAEQQIAASSLSNTQLSFTDHFAPTSVTSRTAAESSRAGATNSRRITFGMTEDMEDPTPPPPPPADVVSHHIFDRSTIATWIYPTNHQIRAYQFNIVRKALFSNTLVSIPTGLGKTFIAAVVMYNYYRWFPNSIMIFMAPTRPLVDQQIKACHNVCGIPQKDTVMMVGSNTGGKYSKRDELWKKARVFFCTPQVVDNDLSKGICPSEKISLLVIDEAHKATGNYAYAKVVERLKKNRSEFRVLALSATPGSTIDKVQAVVNNLRINNIEVRTEESMDVQEYSFGKRVQSILIKLNYTAGATGVVPQAASTFCQEVYQPVLDRLNKKQAIYDNSLDRYSPYTLTLARQRYQAEAKNVPNVIKKMVFSDFMLAEQLSRAYEGLVIYGVPTFVDIMDRNMEEIRETLNNGKGVPKETLKVLNNHGLNRLMDQLRQQMDQPGFVGHPKLEKLLDIVLEHLSNSEQQQQHDGPSSTRIIIFSTLRISVNMIVDFLSRHEPMIKCAPFIGQAADLKGTKGTKGMTQKEQQQTIEKFKRGTINVMVATCIGEEGLDIGEVDLIVCYDSHNSSVRLLQRMGRTGRKRKGHCVMLMTESEERKYKKAEQNYKYLQNSIANRNMIEYCKDVPNVLPKNYQPVVQRKHLAISEYIPSGTTGKRRTQQQQLQQRQQNEEHGRWPAIQKDGTLTAESLDSFLTSFPDGEDISLDQAHNLFWPLTHPLKGTLKYLPQQKQKTRTKYVGHSRATVKFVSLVNKMEQWILHGEDDGHFQPVSDTDSTDPDHSPNTLLLPRRRKIADENESEHYENISDGDHFNIATSPRRTQQQLRKKQKKDDNKNMDTVNGSLNIMQLLKKGIARNSSDDEIGGGLGQMLDDSHPNEWSSVMEPLMTKGLDGEDGDDFVDYRDYHHDDEDDTMGDIQNVSIDYIPSNEIDKVDTTFYQCTLTEQRKEAISDRNMTTDRASNAPVNSRLNLTNDTLAQTTSKNLDDDANKDEDNDKYEFGSVDLAVVDTEMNKHMTKSVATPHSYTNEMNQGFLFDDELPALAPSLQPIMLDSMVRSAFPSSFLWITEKPVFSKQALLYLQENNKRKYKRWISTRIANHDSGSGTGSNTTTIATSVPALLPSVGPTTNSIASINGICVAECAVKNKQTKHRSVRTIDEQHKVTSLIDTRKSNSIDTKDENDGFGMKRSREELKIISNSNIVSPGKVISKNTSDIKTLDPPVDLSISLTADTALIQGASETASDNNGDVDEFDVWEINEEMLQELSPFDVLSESSSKEGEELDLSLFVPTTMAMSARGKIGHLVSPNMTQELPSDDNSGNQAGEIASTDLFPSTAQLSMLETSPIIKTPESEDSPIVRRKRLRRVLTIDDETDEEKSAPSPLRQQHNEKVETTKRSVGWASNPFLDVEADDDDLESEEEEFHEASDVMDSFIYDGSSELVREDSSSMLSPAHNDGQRNNDNHDDVATRHRKPSRGSNDMSMYRSSLLQPEVAVKHGAKPLFETDYPRKTFLDKMEVDKWESIAKEQDHADEDRDEDNFYDAENSAFDDDFENSDYHPDGISRFTNNSDDFM